MKNETDSKISAYLRLAELCGTGDEEKRKQYMVKVENLLNPIINIDDWLDQYFVNHKNEINNDILNFSNTPVKSIFTKHCHDAWLKFKKDKPLNNEQYLNFRIGFYGRCFVKCNYRRD